MYLNFLVKVPTVKGKITRRKKSNVVYIEYEYDRVYDPFENKRVTANLKELLDKRDAIRKEEILSAVVKSGRSYEEIMNFLNAGSDGEKTEK